MSDWIDRAACISADPSIFFDGPFDAAKAVCDGCPVRSQCLQWALDNRETHGVWGGLSAHQRRQRLSTHPIRHGTTSGYQHGGCRCDECSTVMSAYRRRRRRKATA